MINLGFTGTRKGLTLLQRARVIDVMEDLFEPQSTFHHGDCTGADELAHVFASNCGYFIVVHPPENPKQRAYCHGDVIRATYSYMIRNCHIVDETDRMIATPGMMQEELRSGTWHAIRYARKLGRPLYICWPDGSLTKERMP